MGSVHGTHFCAGSAIFHSCFLGRPFSRFNRIGRQTSWPWTQTLSGAVSTARGIQSSSMAILAGIVPLKTKSRSPAISRANSLAVAGKLVSLMKSSGSSSPLLSASCLFSPPFRPCRADRSWHIVVAGLPAFVALALFWRGGFHPAADEVDGRPIVHSRTQQLHCQPYDCVVEFLGGENIGNQFLPIGGRGLLAARCLIFAVGLGPRGSSFGDACGFKCGECGL